MLCRCNGDFYLYWNDGGWMGWVFCKDFSLSCAINKGLLGFQAAFELYDRQPENEICAHSAPLLKFQPNLLICVYI